MSRMGVSDVSRSSVSRCQVLFNILVCILVFFLALLTAGCEIVDPDDVDRSERSTLTAYQELGTLSADQIEEIYPAELGILITWDVTFYRVVYETEDPFGAIVPASGILLVPRGRELSPILSLHRTTIFHENEAPSNVDPGNPPALTEDGTELPAENTVWTNLGPVAASAGFITVMPDLLGWGESSHLPAPYLVSVSEAAVSLDMLRASAEVLTAEDVGWDEQLYLTGYSQGGSTAVALLQSIQNDPDRQFEVTRASAGGGVYNIEDVAAVVLEQEEMGFAPYYLFLLSSYRNVYFPDRPMNTMLNAPYDLILESEPLFEGGYTAGELENLLPARTDQLFLHRFRMNYLSSEISNEAGTGPEAELRSAFRENDLSRFRVEAPLRIYHGEMDEVIPAAETERAVQNLREAGSEQTEFFLIEGGTHRGAAEVYLIHTFAWFLTPWD